MTSTYLATAVTVLARCWQLLQHIERPATSRKRHHEHQCT